MTSAPAAPLARYAAFKRMGDFVFLSGSSQSTLPARWW